MVYLTVLGIDVVHLITLAETTCLILALLEYTNRYHA